MSRPLATLLMLGLSMSAAYAAALVPIPTPQISPVYGLEVNQGQANTGILFLNRPAGIAVTAQSVLYSPLGATLSLVASNPNPSVSFSDPLPGVVNAYTGANPRQWASGVPRYGTATLASIYPGITAQYTVSSNGAFTLNLMLNAGVDPTGITFQIAQASQIVLSSDGSLSASFGMASPHLQPPSITYPAPSASQGSVSRAANYVLESATSFGLSVQDIDSTEPLQISIPISIPISGGSASQTIDVAGPGALWTSDTNGNIYYAATIPDAAGKPAPFNIGVVGCGISINYPIPCVDVAIYKFSAFGVPAFITYLSGRTMDSPSFLALTPAGAVAVAGSTDSSDFPVSAGPYQSAYAGPPAISYGDSDITVAGNYFAATLDPSTGELQASTYLGGPNADALGSAAIGADGSFYLLPAFLGTFTAGLPTTSGALQATCQASPSISGPCANGYVARLTPALDKLIYGTYLPGTLLSIPQVYSDGSLFYSGEAPAGFPTTPGAYQTQNAGGEEGIVARLDPTGSRFMFATYAGGPNTEIFNIAVAPDASVWAAVESPSPGELIHLNATGTALINQEPLTASAMVTNAAGDLFTFASGNITASPNALISGGCNSNGENPATAYIELSPTGQQIFATYVPPDFGGFDGAASDGTPYIDVDPSIAPPNPQAPNSRVEIAQNQSAGPFVGCVVDAATFNNSQLLSPGQIVTIFGSNLGPSPGVSYHPLTNGQLPDTLGGVQVSIGGEPAPLLYSSAGQLNLIVPYSLQPNTAPTVQVTSNGTPANVMQASSISQGITIFETNSAGQAAALNQDGSLNSPQNPAKLGSIVALFGTGGGQTDPPSTAGEVTPLVLRTLSNTPSIFFGSITAVTPVWAGAAPGLVSGVTQINVQLPSVLPANPNVPPGMLPVEVSSPSGFYPGVAYIAIATN